MKKIITLVLAIALLMTSVVALAETAEAPAYKGTPNVNTFATMKTKYNEKDHIITITLSKPVDQLWIVWAEKGAQPEQLAVDDNLQATALTWNHKYMPGTKQIYGTKTVEEKTYWDWEYDADSSEWYYVVSDTDYVDIPDDAYFVLDTDVDETWELWDLDNVDFDIWNYKQNYPNDKYEIVKPKKSGFKDEFGYDIIVPGYIFGYSSERINLHRPTVIATAADIAYKTVQNGCAVYYNRAGKIVGIEPYEGQF